MSWGFVGLPFSLVRREWLQGALAAWEILVTGGLFVFMNRGRRSGALRDPSLGRVGLVFALGIVVAVLALVGVFLFGT